MPQQAPAPVIYGPNGQTARWNGSEYVMDAPAAPAAASGYTFQPNPTAQQDRAWEAEDRAFQRQRQAAADARAEADLRMREEAAGLRGNPYQRKFEEARGTRDATRFDEALSGWQSAPSMIATADRAEQLLDDGAPVGSFADQRIAAGRFAGDWLGFLPGIPNRRETQQLEQLRLLGSQGALGDVSKLRGPLSEKELAFIQRMQIDPNATADTNRNVAETMRWAGRRQAAYGEAMQDWVNRYGSPSATNADGRSFDAWWADYAAQALPQPMPGEASLPGPTVPDGRVPMRPENALSVAPGEYAADYVAHFDRNGDNVASVEEMQAAGWTWDREAEKWFPPAGMGDGGGAPPPSGPSPAPAGPQGPETPEMRRERLAREAEARQAAREGRGGFLGDAWRNVESFSQSVTEQIPFLDELAALTVAGLTGESYGDVRAAQAGMAQYDRENYGAARNIGGITGAGATVVTPLGAPLRVVQGTTRAGRAVNAAAGGALGGAVYGAGQGEGGPVQRTGNALGGAAFGAAFGPVAEPVARRVVDGGRALGRTLVTALGDRLPAPVRQAVARDPLESGMALFARRSPQDVEIIRNEAARLQAETISPTFADVINDGGRGVVRALATRQTPARQAAREFADARAVDIQDRVAAQARRHISDDTRTPAEIRDEAQRMALEKSDPFYEAAMAMQAEPTPALEELMRRPAVRAALEKARRLAANEGVSGEERRILALAGEGLPTGGGSAVPRPAADPNLSADLRALRDAVSDRKASRGKTLMQFVAENGGIRDEWGELTAIGTDGWSRGAPWRRQILQENGLTLEQMAQRAADAGYFDDLARPGMDDAANMSIVDRDRLLQAFDDEMAGRDFRYAREADPAALARKERRADLEERLTREGLNPRATTAREASRAFDDADDFEARMAAHLNGDPVGPPEVHLVESSRPTMRTLDYVKRALDDVLQSYKDPVTGRLNLDDEGRTIEGIRRRLLQELDEMNPAYRAARRAYADPISEQFAVSTGEDFMRPRTDEFVSAVESFTPRQRAAARAGAARAVERAAGTQGQAPGVARNLASGSEQARRTAALLGDAAPLQRAMQAELDALERARAVNPMQGSPTSLNTADRGIAAAATDLAGAVRDAGTGNAAGLAIRAADAALKRANRGFTDAEAEAIVSAAIDPARMGDLVELLQQRMTPRAARNLARAMRYQVNRALQLQQEPVRQ